MPDDSVRGKLNSVITQRMEVAPGLIILQVAPDGWELSDFTSGQYCVLGLPGSASRCRRADPEEEEADPAKLIRRAYSIASSSVAKEYLEFYVALVRSGALTPRLFALEVGNPVAMGPKITGMFTLDKVPEQMNVILFATGTGVAPYISMMRTVLARDTGRRFAIVHGARHSWDLGYRAELITLERICPNFDYIPIIDHPNEEPIPWGGRTGWCQDVWRDRVIDQLWGFRSTPENTHHFLCGNPVMIREMIRVLAEDGFREQTKKVPGEVHLEKFW